MSRQQLLAFFSCNLVLFTVGGSLVTLLPIYALRLGADASMTGYFLSFAFLALAISTGVGGWLSDRFQRRRLILILAGLALTPATWLIGQATTIPQLIVFSALVWFIAGIVATMVNILAGMSAGEHERGRVFGILNLASPLGALIGGLVAGRIVDQFGFPAMLNVSALVLLLIPLIGWWVNEVVVKAGGLKGIASIPIRSILTSRVFLCLFVACILAHIANSEFNLGKTLIMNDAGFDANAISSTSAAGGLLAMPLPILAGWLSDRIGRKILLAVSYVAVASGLVILVAAVSLWHFWVATALQITLNATIAVSSAFVTDLFPRESVGKPLALFGAAPWIGLVIGYLGAGNFIQSSGMATTLWSGVLLTAISVVLITAIRSPILQAQPAMD
jgi:MFS family permease